MREINPGRDENEFERDKLIDPNNLDLECLNQPELFCKWADRATLAEEYYEAAKFKTKVVEACLQNDARANPEKFGLTKVTDTAIKATALIHDSHQEAYKAEIEAQRILGLLKNAVRTMDMKKRMIEELGRLHGQKYFAGPSVARTLDRSWHERKQGDDENLIDRQRKGLRRRKRKDEDD